MLFLEALYIQTLAPKINDGLKAKCKLALFQYSSICLRLTFGQWSFCFSGCFVGLEQIHVLIITLSRSNNCLLRILWKFDNYFNRATVDLNWPLTHWSFGINWHCAAIKQLHGLIIVLPKFDNCFFCVFLSYTFKFSLSNFRKIFLYVNSICFYYIIENDEIK